MLILGGMIGFHRTMLNCCSQLDKNMPQETIEFGLAVGLAQVLIEPFCFFAGQVSPSICSTSRSAGHHHCPQAWVVEGDGRSRGGVQKMEGHAVAPDLGPALDDDQRAAGDGGQQGDCDGEGDWGGHFMHLSFESWHSSM